MLKINVILSHSGLLSHTIGPTSRLPYTLAAKVVEATPGQSCPSTEQWEAARAQVNEEVSSLFEQEYGYRPTLK